MATLKDLDDLMTRLAEASEGLTLHEYKRLILSEGVKEFQGQKMYWPAPDTSKREQIERAVKTLPTSVVAERFGVTQSYARQIRCRVVIKKRN